MIKVSIFLLDNEVTYDGESVLYIELSVLHNPTVCHSIEFLFESCSSGSFVM